MGWRDRNGSGWGRRRFLGAIGAAGTATLVGCSGVTEREFVAVHVVLPAPARSAHGAVTASEDPVRRDLTRTIGGQEVSATVESFVAVYEVTAGPEEQS